MRVLVAPAAFGAGLGAVGAARAMSAGWSRQEPRDELTECPVTAGGPDFVDVLRRHLEGRAIQVPVHAEGGDPATATLLHVAGPTPTVFVESAHVCGPRGGVGPDPAHRGSAGLGAAIRHARSLGAARIVIGLGGEVCHDGGAGLLAELSDSRSPRLRAGGLALSGIGPGELDFLPALREEMAGTDLVAVHDDPCPLLGFHGTSATTAQDKGATPEQAQQLERALSDLAAAASRALGERPGRGGPAAASGAGAGGGIGYALSLLGARLVPGPEFAVDTFDLADRMARTDLVLTGRHVFGWRCLRDSLTTALAGLASRRAVPVVVLAVGSQVGRREARAAGVDALYTVSGASSDDDRAPAAEELTQALGEHAARIARSWSIG